MSHSADRRPAHRNGAPPTPAPDEKSANGRHAHDKHSTSRAPYALAAYHQRNRKRSAAAWEVRHG